MQWTFSDVEEMLRNLKIEDTSLKECSTVLVSFTKLLQIYYRCSVSNASRFSRYWFIIKAWFLCVDDLTDLSEVPMGPVDTLVQIHPSTATSTLWRTSMGTSFTVGILLRFSDALSSASGNLFLLLVNRVSPRYRWYPNRFYVIILVHTGIEHLIVF